jgi:hypothetical protein
MFQTTNQICLTICGRIHLFGLVFFSQGPNPADLGQWPTWWSPGFEKKMWSRPVINCVITSDYLNLSIVNPSQLISLCSYNLGNPFLYQFDTCSKLSVTPLYVRDFQFMDGVFFANVQKIVFYEGENQLTSSTNHPLSVILSQVISSYCSCSTNTY